MSEGSNQTERLLCYGLINPEQHIRKEKRPQMFVQIKLSSLPWQGSPSFKGNDGIARLRFALENKKNSF